MRTISDGIVQLASVYDHFSMIPEDPFHAGSRANTLVLAIRKRKGLKEDLPVLSYYADTL
jgi:elongation factor 2